MGFLDNSGDIILDAVLTDTGRYRLAKGDGSFKISKFALGDDEINYTNYDKNNLSGSAYYDLDILQTPVLEAFTNNTSTLNSRLISISRTNLLFLPVMKANTNEAPLPDMTNWSQLFYVTVDDSTNGASSGVDISNSANKGVLNGLSPGATQRYIRVDQGLDTTEIPPAQGLSAALRETQYIIQLDSRLGVITSLGTTGAVQDAPISFIDDDNIASYYLSEGSNPSFVSQVPFADASDETDTAKAGTHVIAGPRGTMLQFKVRAAMELQQSSYLFDTIGGTQTVKRIGTSTDVTVKYVDTSIKITGATTGYSLDIPVRFIKV